MLSDLIGKRPFEALTTYQKFTNGKDHKEEVKEEVVEKKEEAIVPTESTGETTKEVTGDVAK